MTDNGTPKPPEGYGAVSASEANGWWKPEVGSVVCGRLLGRFSMKNGRNYYQVRLGEDSLGVKIVTGRGEKSELINAKVGMVVNFDERSGLKGLHPYTASDGTFDVWILAKELVPIEGGNTWWRFKVQYKTLKSPSVPVDKTLGQESSQPSQDDIPF